jgi:hypothetical protein
VQVCSDVSSTAHRPQLTTPSASNRTPVQIRISRNAHKDAKPRMVHLSRPCRYCARRCSRHPAGDRRRSHHRALIKNECVRQALKMNLAPPAHAENLYRRRRPQVFVFDHQADQLSGRSNAELCQITGSVNLHGFLHDAEAARDLFVLQSGCNVVYHLALTGRLFITGFVTGFIPILHDMTGAVLGDLSVEFLRNITLWWGLSGDPGGADPQDRRSRHGRHRIVLSGHWPARRGVKHFQA